MLTRGFGFAISLARMLWHGRKAPDGHGSLSFVRSEGSHEASAKFARLLGLVFEWSRGIYRAEDHTDALRILDDLDRLHTRLAWLAVERPATTWSLASLLADFSAVRRGIGPLRRGEPLARSVLTSAQARIERSQSRSRSLVEQICLRRGATIQSIVAESMDTVRREAHRDRAGAHLSIVRDEAVASSPLWIPRADAAPWRDIFTNLIRNAAQATADSSTASGTAVLVRALDEVHSSGVRIEIEDRGIGMTVETVGAIWREGVSRHGATRGAGLTPAKRDFLETRTRLEIRSELGRGSCFALSFHRTDVLLATPPPSQRSAVAASVLFAAVLLLAGTWHWSRPGIAAFELTPQGKLVATDESGRIVREFASQRGIVANEGGADPTGRIEPDPKIPFVAIREGDRLQGAIVSVSSDSGPGSIRLLDERGQVEWDRPLSMADPGGLFGRLISHWQVEIPWVDGHPAFAVSVRDHLYSPSMVMVLDDEGDSLAAYYHPGHLSFRACKDFDTDGRTELLLHGVNNPASRDPRIVPSEDARRVPRFVRCIVLLESSDIAGQAYPYSSWDSIPPACEEAYVLIPPLSEDTDSAIQYIDIVQPDPKSPAKFEVRTLDGRIYELDARLRPMSLRAGDLTPAATLAGCVTPPPVLYLHKGQQEFVDLDFPSLPGKARDDDLPHAPDHR